MSKVIFLQKNNGYFTQVDANTAIAERLNGREGKAARFAVKDNDIYMSVPFSADCSELICVLYAARENSSSELQLHVFAHWFSGFGNCWARKRGEKMTLEFEFWHQAGLRMFEHSSFFKLERPIDLQGTQAAQLVRVLCETFPDYEIVFKYGS